LLGAALSIAVSIRINIGLTALDQRLALLRKIQPFGERQACFWSASPSAKGSPIWSRASQNAAALLFDLGTVDVR
jgi:hypothetical protein